MDTLKEQYEAKISELQVTVERLSAPFTEREVWSRAARMAWDQVPVYNAIIAARREIK